VVSIGPLPQHDNGIGEGRASGHCRDDIKTAWHDMRNPLIALGDSPWEDAAGFRTSLRAQSMVRRTIGIGQVKLMRPHGGV
jgi:hypothetical protein